ncbi:hypothetical protein U737_02545 [Methylomonas sp. LW13]|nr:hypothetical protein U737_02545 [Methylomonas sp. LW13]
MSSRKNAALYCGFQQYAAVSDVGKQLIGQLSAGKSTKKSGVCLGGSVIRRPLTAGEAMALNSKMANRLA